MPWYKTGTVALTAGSATVTGTGTAFSANARVGDAFIVPGVQIYEVTNIASATVLTISPAFGGTTAASSAYALAPMQGYVKASADALNSLVTQFGVIIASLGPLASATVALVANGGTGGATPLAARQNIGALGGKNLLVNANFSINQRNYASSAVTTTANQYIFDMWRVVTSGQAVSYAASGTGNQITAPAGGIEQVVESFNLEASVHTLTWTGTATATVNGTAISNGGQTAVLTANASIVVRFTGGTVKEPQLEIGSVATTFDRRPRPIDLSICYWYFERIYFNGAYSPMAIGQCTNTYVASGIGYFQYPKRVNPTIIPGSSNAYSLQTANGGGDTAANVSFNYKSNNIFSWAATSATSSLLTGNTTMLIGNSGGTNYLDFSAVI